MTRPDLASAARESSASSLSPVYDRASVRFRGCGAWREANVEHGATTPTLSEIEMTASIAAWADCIAAIAATRDGCNFSPRRVGRRTSSPSPAMPTGSVCAFAVDQAGRKAERPDCTQAHPRT